MSSERSNVWLTLVLLFVIVLMFSVSCSDEDVIINSADPECSPGNVWTNVDWQGGEGLRDVIWADSLFVAVGNSDIWTSTDGIEWDKTDAPWALQDIAWSGAILVGIGSYIGGGPAILTSTDAIDWTEQIVPVDKQLKDVVWAGNEFIAVGEVGVIISSTDGVIWTEQTVDYGGSPPAWLSCVEWSGSTIVALGLPDMVSVWSANGTDWSLGSMYPPYTGALDVALVDSFLISVGVDGQMMLSSTGGRNWAYVYSPTGLNLFGITWNGEQCVIVGDSGMIITSPDGNNWTQRFSGVGKRLQQAAFSKGQCKWVAVGAHDVLVSTD